jgi:hypothetical protein
MPMVIKDRLIMGGGWVDVAGDNVFNEYRPPNVITGNASQVGRWLDHFKLIYSDTYEYMILGIASKVQHPEVKINHCQVWGGISRHR